MEAVAIIYVSLQLLIYSQIYTFAAFGIMLMNLKDLRAMFHTLLALWLAVAFVLGVPVGLIEYIYPELETPIDKILEEAGKWTQ